jgi:hypothetical protein
MLFLYQKINVVFVLIMYALHAYINFQILIQKFMDFLKIIIVKIVGHYYFNLIMLDKIYLK